MYYYFFLFVRTQTSVIVAHMVTTTDTVTTALPSKLYVQRKHGIFVSFIWLDDWNRFNTGSVFHDKKPCPLPVSVDGALLAGEFRTRHFVFPNQHWLSTNHHKYRSLILNTVLIIDRTLNKKLYLNNNSTFQ